MYFLIFQPEDMLKLCLIFYESQPVHAYVPYDYIHVSVSNIDYNFQKLELKNWELNKSYNQDQSALLNKEMFFFLNI